MSHDNHQLDLKRSEREFDTPQNKFIDQIARIADDKQIAEPLIEDDLRRDARIGASQDRCDRLLFVNQRGSVIWFAMRIQRFPGGKPTVAIDELRESVLRRFGNVFLRFVLQEVRVKEYSTNNQRYSRVRGWFKGKEVGCVQGVAHYLIA